MSSDQERWEGEERRKQSGWHVGREIPLGFIFAILVQTMGGIWWASSISAKLDSAITTMIEFKLDRYTQGDAKRDRDLMLAIVESVRANDRELERRLAVIERQHEVLNSNALEKARTGK